MLRPVLNLVEFLEVADKSVKVADKVQKLADKMKK
jgi:hypothetical protein